MSRYSRVSLSLSALAFLIAAPRAQASGFQLREQGASGQGQSYAGISAGGSDISSMFYNPATLTRFEGRAFQMGFTNIMPSTKFSEGMAKPSDFGPATFPAVQVPDSHGNAALSAVTPTLYAMWSLDKDLKVGVSVNVPYGLTTDYDSNWIGRYHALRSHLQTVDITPTVAWRINGQWSVGASFVARQAKAELSQAVDFGYQAFAAVTQLGLTNSLPGVAQIVHPGAADGAVGVKGDSWGYGYKAGLLYEPTRTFRVGLGYQSAMKEDLKGTATFSIPSTVALGMHYLGLANPSPTGQLKLQGMAAAFAAATTDGPVSAELNLPSVISLGASYDLSPTFTVSVEAQRTQWSTFKELRLKFPNPLTQPDSYTNEYWKDTTFISVGAACHPDSTWTYRLGLARDNSAVSDAFRTPRIPDADRTWLSAGLSCQLAKGFAVDLGLTHIFVKDSTVDLKGGTSPTDSPDFFKGDLRGVYKNAIDIWALQARWSF